MPTIFVWNGLRFFFYSNEGSEPPHIHVRGGGCEAKVWLSDLTVARNHGFADRQMTDIMRQADLNRVRLLNAWRLHFGR